MVYENINFREANMTYHDGYFYFFDDSFDVLYQKVADGDTAFTYPLSDVIGSNVTSLEYDGINFWTMQDIGGNVQGVVIKRWQLEGNICTLKDEFVYPIVFAAGSLIFEDDFEDDTYVGTWTIGGTAGSSMIESGGNLKVSSYGSGGGDIGPYATTTLSGSFTDFSMGVLWNLLSYGTTSCAGRWEISLRDASDTSIIRIGNHDDFGNTTIVETYLYDKVTQKFNTQTQGSPYFASQSVTNTIAIQRSGSNLLIFLNGSQLYDGAISTDSIKNIRLLYQRRVLGGLTAMVEVSTESLTIVSGALHKMDSEAFTVEHYHDTFSTTASGGDSTISLNLYDDSLVVSGTILTLGPNSSDEQEDSTVISGSGSNIVLSSGVQYSYATGDEIRFRNNLWVFNNYDGLNSGGSLYKFDAHTGDYIEHTASVSYEDISACTFSRVRNVTTSRVDALIYINDSNLSYLNPDNLAVYDTMTIDTLKPPSTYIKVYDMALDGNNIYRLQSEARYYETNYSWSTYNYVISTVRRFIGSVSLSAYPTILPANGVNVSDLSTLVSDQYGDGMISKPVFFTDTDSVGFITTNPAYTDYFFGTGEAVSAYKAGITNGDVTIEATATQFD